MEELVLSLSLFLSQPLSACGSARVPPSIIQSCPNPGRKRFFKITCDHSKSACSVLEAWASVTSTAMEHRLARGRS